MGIIASENFQYLLDPGLRKIFTDEIAQPEDTLAQIYSDEKSGKATEYDLGVGGLGDLEEFTGTIPYGDFSQQYRTSYSHREWVKGIKIERKLVDDDLYGIINARPKALGMTANRTKSKHRAQIFNNAFNTTIFAGGDTLALCSTAHTFVGTATTVSNRGTTALSATALEALRIRMKQFTDETDNYIDPVPDTLIVPLNLEELAYQINKSDKILSSNFNDPNFQQGKWKIIVSVRLTDTNNYFICDSRLAKLWLKWFTRIPVEFNKDSDMDTYVKKWSCYTRYSYGFSGWPWIIGSEVS